MGCGVDGVCRTEGEGVYDALRALSVCFTPSRAVRSLCAAGDMPKLRSCRPVHPPGVPRLFRAMLMARVFLFLCF